MSAVDLAKQASELPATERLKLAQLIMESVQSDEMDKAILEGVQRVEDILSGRIVGLTEDEFRAALR